MTTPRAARPWHAMRVTPALAGGGLLCGFALGTGALALPCWFRALTGVDCPFCGGSRALGDLLHGDIVASVGHNAYAVVIVLPLVVAVLTALARWETGRASRWWPAGKAGTTLTIGLVVLTAAWWVFRGLPAGAWFRSA